MIRRSLRGATLLASVALLASCSKDSTEPEIQLTMSYSVVGDQLNPIAAGGSRALDFQVQRSGYTGPITISGSGLPSGVTITPVTLSTGETTGSLTVTVAPATTAGSKTINLAIEGEGVSGQSNFILETVAASGTLLTSGTAVTGLSGASGTTREYRITVPAGKTRLTVSLSGGTGDAELFVRRGGPADLFANDCESSNTGNNETCVFDNPSATDYYIRIAGFFAYSSTSLVATVQP